MYIPGERHKKLPPSSRPLISLICVLSPAASFVDIGLRVEWVLLWSGEALRPTHHSMFSLASVILTVSTLEEFLISSRDDHVARPSSPRRSCPIIPANGGMLSTL